MIQSFLIYLIGNLVASGFDNGKSCKFILSVMKGNGPSDNWEEQDISDKNNYQNWSDDHCGTKNFTV